MKLLAKTSFMLGILLAVIVSLIPDFGIHASLFGVGWGTMLLIFIGFISGCIHLRKSKTTSFLITTIILLTIGNAGIVVSGGIGAMMGGMMLNIMAFIIPASSIMALKAVYEMLAH